MLPEVRPPVENSQSLLRTTAIPGPSSKRHDHVCSLRTPESSSSGTGFKPWTPLWDRSSTKTSTTWELSILIRNLAGQPSCRRIRYKVGRSYNPLLLHLVHNIAVKQEY